ncbi:MAG: penicillin-binding transpeptidase domain-containing protein [Eubacteriales bacterium]|nr:penicillin-binding transpeptidase domain-containing protein [Eubacteriales bacterium]
MVLQGPVVRRRLALGMAVFFALILILGARLFVLQVVRSEELVSRAINQWTGESVISARRGPILDRDGKVLAISASAYTVSVSPRQALEPQRLAAILSPILDMDEEEILRRATDTSKGGVTIKRQVPREIALEIRTIAAEHAKEGSDALSGLYLEEDSKRYYPMGAFAVQLLGLTTIDGVGQSGLEQALDEYLRGEDGSIKTEIDGRGRSLGGGDAQYIPAQDGCSVTLTIDSSIQAFAEQAAREAMTVNGAKSVRVLAMDPQTGEILAMVMKPDYDPNDPPRSDVALLTSLMRNTVISDAYEPGSTFKIITAAAALESGVTRTSEGFYCSGSITVDGSRIRCWGDPHGAQSMAQTLENSCNPAFVELGLRIGTQRFYDFLDLFGFGKKTGVDIPGEAAGILIKEENVKRVDMARIGFGQSVAVTPIQLLRAACAAVNGGRLVTPHVVSRIEDAGGNAVYSAQREVVSQPISAETSALMRTLLEGVVENGGGRNARVEGYRIGGKTGTAQVYIDGVVSRDTHIGSFLGFAPMDDPKIAVLFIVDQAEKRPDYGSVTAAPFARDILLKSLNSMGVWAEGTALRQTTAVPDVTGMSVGSAAKAVSEAGLRYVLDGDGAQVLDQLPVPGSEMAKGSVMMLYVEPDARAEASIPVPDVTGMNIADAQETLGAWGLQLQAQGEGLAVRQSPEAGEYAVPTALVQVHFVPPGPKEDE